MHLEKKMLQEAAPSIPKKKKKTHYIWKSCTANNFSGKKWDKNKKGKVNDGSFVKASKWNQPKTTEWPLMVPLRAPTCLQQEAVPTRESQQMFVPLTEARDEFKSSRPSWTICIFKQTAGALRKHLRENTMNHQRLYNFWWKLHKHWHSEHNLSMKSEQIEADHRNEKWRCIKPDCNQRPSILTAGRLLSKPSH